MLLKKHAIYRFDGLPNKMAFEHAGIFAIIGLIKFDKFNFNIRTNPTPKVLLILLHFGQRVGKQRHVYNVTGLHRRTKGFLKIFTSQLFAPYTTLHYPPHRFPVSLWLSYTLGMCFLFPHVPCSLAVYYGNVEWNVFFFMRLWFSVMTEC